jgi:hypothetical protein
LSLTQNARSADLLSLYNETKGEIANLAAELQNFQYARSKDIQSLYNELAGEALSTKISDCSQNFVNYSEIFHQGKILLNAFSFPDLLMSGFDWIESSVILLPNLQFLH